MSERLRPKIVVRRGSPHTSARISGVRVNLIVLHSTESANYDGKRDLEGVAGWFANPASQVSCHVIVDNDGHSARCVADSRKAWHCSAYNSASLGIEQIGYAADGEDAWRRKDDELREAARWIAAWSIRHEIPIQKAEVTRGHVTRAGITTHKALGELGGNHSDPGAYPFDHVLRLAREIKRKRRS
jgi:N-acetyl-anhydromuramyl-L-alanine amidase AmpD